MAAFVRSSTTYTENDAWFEGGSRRVHVRDVTLVLSSQGGLTNSIPASAFGMTKIIGASGFRDSSSVIVQAAPSYDGSKLVFCTAETAGTPADQTGTFRGLVRGYV